MSARTTEHDAASSPELLCRFADAGDQAAFAGIVRRHGAWMLGAAVRMTGEADMAADVLQESLALLARKVPRCPTEAAFTAWLHRTVLFTARNHMARERRRALLLNRFEQHCETVQPAAPEIPEAALRMLDAVIEELPGADRDLITGRYLARQAWDDLGAACGRSAEAVRKQVDRILERMASRLRRRGVALPSGALVAALTDQSSAALSAAQAASLTAAACDASARISIAALLSHTVITMNTAKLILGTAAVCALLFSIPLTLVSRRLAAAETRAAAAENRLDGLKFGSRTPEGRSGAIPVSAGHANSSGPAPAAFSTPPGAGAAMNVLGKALAGIAESAAGPADKVNAPLVDAVKAVMTDPDRSRRVTGLNFLLQWMRTVDVPAVNAAMEAGKLPGVLYVNEGNALRERWGALAGREAMLDYTKGRTDNAYNRLHSAIVRGWASTDPDGLKVWLDSLPETCDWKDRAGADVLEGMLRGDPARATEAALKSDPRTLGAVLPRIADSVLQTQGLDGLEKWMRALPAGSETSKARAGVAFQLVEGRAFADPDAAVASLRAFESEPWGGAVMAKQLGDRFGRASQERALAMLDRLPVDSGLAVSLSAALFDSLARNQPNAAAAWLNSNGASPYADRAAEALARAVQTSDPAGAQAWARTIRDETRRATVLSELGLGK